MRAAPEQPQPGVFGSWIIQVVEECDAQLEICFVLGRKLRKRVRQLNSRQGSFIEGVVAGVCHHLKVLHKSGFRHRENNVHAAPLSETGNFGHYRVPISPEAVEELVEIGTKINTL